MTLERPRYVEALCFKRTSMEVNQQQSFFIDYAFHAMNLTVSLLNATGSKSFSTDTIRHERELPILLRVSTFRQLVFVELSLLPQNVALLYRILLQYSSIYLKSARLVHVYIFYHLQC